MSATGVGQQELLDRMRSVARRHGDDIAVREPTRDVTYSELEASIAAIRHLLSERVGLPGDPVGLLAERSAAAYATMWAALSLGRPYVPLNPAYPRSRLVEIIDQAGVRDIVATTSTAATAHDLATGQARVLVADEIEPSRSVDPDTLWEATAGSEVAYLLFTSGSTGRPKGVPISQANLLAYVDAMAATIAIGPRDVCSQLCELSFDLSVQEIYPALLSGATLCPARTIDVMNPAPYVARNGLTVWVAVPSLARVVLEGPLAVDDQLGSLRLSVFNGEPLTGRLAGRWRSAAPNSTLWNTYGPTECTVAVTHQVWDGRADLEHDGVIAIGTPLPGCRTAIDDGGVIRSTATADDGTAGELLIAGPQRFAGYLDRSLPSPFVTDGDVTWYRTGDRVRWRSGRLFHLGRIDHQVKIGGHRIELPEVEHRLREVLGHDSFAVVANPRPHPTELVLLGTDIDRAAVTADATGLPTYMVPRRILELGSLPTNVSGKLDRGALQRLAAAGR